MTQAVGPLLRDWRLRRRLSQLDLAIEANVSARHLSFIETGRSRPSEQMVLHLAEHLSVPLRERNQLLLAAGFAPKYGARPLQDPEMAPVRAAVDTVLQGYLPFPAIAVDRSWNLVSANASASMLMAGVDESLLVPPVNVLRLSLHPRGMAPRIVNLGQWRRHLLERLAREAATTGAAELRELHEELSGYASGGDASGGPDLGIVLPLRLAVDGGELNFLSTVTTFGSANDVTVAELSIEAFLPADAATAEAVRSLLPDR